MKEESAASNLTLEMEGTPEEGICQECFGIGVGHKGSKCGTCRGEGVVQVQLLEECGRCSGVGRIAIQFKSGYIEDRRCPQCAGKGRV